MRAEVVGMLIEMSKQEDVYLTLMGGSPFFTKTWDGNIRDFEEEDVNILGFTLYPVHSCYKSRYDFVMQNPDALVLDVGRLTDLGLKQSWLSCKTDDEISLKKWKKISEIIKKNTLSGAVAVNPKTGESSPSKSHRYTIGAKEMLQSGIEMLPVAGFVRFKF
jgi:hypothetical protein